MIKLISLILYPTFFWGCNDGNSFSNKYKENSDTVIVFSKFPKEESVKFEPFFKPNQSYVRGVFLTDTSIIITNDKELNTGYFFNEYSLSNKEHVGSYIKGGTKKGMTLSPVSFGLYQKNKLFVKDISLRKTIIASLVDKYSFDSVATEDYKSHQFDYTEQLIDSNKILKSSILDTLPEILQIADLKNDTLIKAFGHLPQSPENIPFGSWKHANLNFLFIKPDAKKAVIAWRYEDKIEVFDLNTQKGITVKGPENIELSFLPIKAGTRYMSQPTEKTTYTYKSGYTTDKYIYLLYYGKKEDSPSHIDGNIIYVFNRNGNPIKKMQLDRNIQGFAVTQDDFTIYAFDAESQTIVRAKLN